jgi:hypothetical protein
MPAGFISYLHCSSYPHLFGLGLATTAVWFLSFDLIVLIIICQTMPFASSAEIFIFSVIVSQALINIHIIA